MSAAKKVVEKKIAEGVYQFESVPCGLCGGEDFDVIATKDRYGLDNRVVTCKQGRINKLIFICEDRNQAEIVADNARRRDDQKHINITTTKPYYNPNRYLAQVKTIEDYPSWYQVRYF